MRPIPKLFAAPHTKLVPFITAGFPDKSLTRDLALALESAGAHMLEIGMPFSDPLADGPVIEAAGQTALKGGATLPWILEMVADLKQTLTIPLVLMGYFNPIMKLGEGRFVKLAVQAGVDGLIIPDLPPGQRDPFFMQVKKAGMSVIPLVAPNTPGDRVGEIGRRYPDLLYAVSLMGVTGTALPGVGAPESGTGEPLADYLGRIRQATGTSFMVGFGIRTPEDAARISPLADGIVVGSELIKKIGAARDPVKAAVDYIASLARALD